MAVLNLVHEILHSFGAEHDPAGIYIKLPIRFNYPNFSFYRCKWELENISFSDKHGKRTKNYGGRYLMSQYSNSGIRENHSRLSPRSKKAVQKVLSDTRMTYCLHRINNNDASFCGDGVIQNGEVRDTFCHLLIWS